MNISFCLVENLERFPRYRDFKICIFATGGAIERDSKMFKINLRGRFWAKFNKRRLFPDSFGVKESKFDTKKTNFST